MAAPAPTRRRPGRWAVAPERALAWLGLAGLGCYGALWIVHAVFYGSFDVSLAMVGVGQAQLVTAAGAFALWLGLLLAYPVVIVRFLVSPGLPRGRVAVLEAAFSAPLLVGGGVVLARVASLHAALDDPNSTSVVKPLATFMGMAGFLGLALFLKGLSGLSARWQDRWLRLIRKRWRVRRYLRRDVSAEAVITTYLPARREVRQRRAAWRRDLRAAGRTYRLALVAMGGLGFFLAIAALAFTAQHDAEAQIAGRKYETNLVYDVLTAGTVARPTQVIAHDPRLRSLEEAKVLYLGTHDGMDVLYDRTAKHALLVPAGSVALVLLPR